MFFILYTFISRSEIIIIIQNDKIVRLENHLRVETATVCNYPRLSNFATAAV